MELINVQFYSYLQYSAAILIESPGKEKRKKKPLLCITTDRFAGSRVTGENQSKGRQVQINR